MTIQELQKYFSENMGPVFVSPSASLLFRYKRMDGMLGLVRPPWAASGAVRVDWTLDKRWNILGVTQKPLPTESLMMSELSFLKLGVDIPQEADDRFLNHNWMPQNLGDVVCISDARLRLYKTQYPMLGSQYTQVKNKVGVVVEKCNVDSDYIMVTFTSAKESIVQNIPAEFLVKLPESFRPSHHKKKDSPVITPSKPLYPVGQTVQINSSVTDEVFMGLLGVVEKIHEVDPTGYKKTSDWEYTVDFNLLPNRCLSLCDGETDAIAITSTTRLAERHLTKWDENVSDKPYFAIYRAYGDRAKVWVPHKQKSGTVQVVSSPTKSVEDGIDLKVNIKAGLQSSMTCRDVDYKWNSMELAQKLRDSFITLGVEQDESNPNTPKQQYVYLYLFDYAKDVGSHVQYRVLLGSLLRRKSTQKKFVRALIGNKLTHPWQVIRYLKVKSLGYFYELFDAQSYLSSVSEFCHVE